MNHKKRQLPSLRTRMVMVSIGSVLGALFLCVIVFVLFLYQILSGYFKNDLEFALEETGSSFSAKGAYLEDILLRLRNDTFLTQALRTGSLIPESQGVSDTSNALKNAAELFSSKNTDKLNVPFLDMVYIFDAKGVLNRSTFQDNLFSEQTVLDNRYREYYYTALKSSTDVLVLPNETHINIIYTLYDTWLESVGTVIFAVNNEAVRQSMEKIENYQGSFWLVFSKDNFCLQAGSVSDFSQTAVQTFTLMQKDYPYSYKAEAANYIIFTQPPVMGLGCVMGIPENQFSMLFYQAMQPYLLVIGICMLTVGLMVFLSVLRLTKPLAEVTHNLRQVGDKNFTVKLPTYETREFEAIGIAFNTMTDTIDHLIHDVYEKKLLVMDSEMKVLQAQINPHFMYNVLHTMAIQARMDGSTDVANMASSFAGLMQARLAHRGEEKTTLEQELQYVKFYLELQKYRFPKKLFYHISVENPALLQFYIPCLTLEMLVENAVVHGIEPKPVSGTVYVDISSQDESIIILVEDDGVGFAGQDGIVALPMSSPTGKKPDGHNHIALNNTYTLLRHFYGAQYGIRIESRPGAGTRITITIPKDKGEE